MLGIIVYVSLRGGLHLLHLPCSSSSLFGTWGAMYEIEAQKKRCRREGRLVCKSSSLISRKAPKTMLPTLATISIVDDLLYHEILLGQFGNCTEVDSVIEAMNTKSNIRLRLMS